MFSFFQQKDLTVYVLITSDIISEGLNYEIKNSAFTLYTFATGVTHYCVVEDLSLLKTQYVYSTEETFLHDTLGILKQTLQNF